MRHARSLLRHVITGTIICTLGACSDSSIAPLAPAGPSASRADDGNDSESRDGSRLFDRYVAIGTSISEGWRSEGVVASSQLESWPVQLAQLAGRTMSLPLIAEPGCGAPFAAPLISFKRVSGESAGASLLQRMCAGLQPGVHLPAANLAISGALTEAALLATPEHPDPAYAPLYPDVLPPGQSQVTAMAAQHPTLVSVELGGNDVLGARDGAYIPGVTVVPVTAWAPIYNQVVARVARASRRAVLVGLPIHAENFPSFRTGDELWRARASFLPFNVAVSPDCNGSANALFVADVVPTAVATGAYYGNNHLGPYTLSCVDRSTAASGTSFVPDYIVSPRDIALVDAQLVAMNVVIRAEAAARGFAYYSLGALYDDAVTKAPFDAVALMTSAEPYGPYISLDGVHPSAKGNQILAAAAARALAARYDVEFALPGALIASRDER